MANSQERKQQIMDHVKRTTLLPQQLALANTNSDAKKQQIMDHVKRTRG